MAPSVSLQTVAYTFDSKDALLASAISKSPSDGVSVLSFVLSADGEIPKDGLIVTVNSNIQFREYFAFLAERPFNLGGEFVGAVFNSKGEATGFKYRLTQPKAIINLRPQDNSAGISNDVVKFSLEPSKDYNIDAKAGSSQVVFYENLAQVPAPSIVPEVKLSINNSTLNEATGNTTTLTFNLSAAPPKEGVLVYIKGDRNVGFDAGATILSEFDLFKAKVTGGAFPTPDSLANGFYFKITEQTATLTLSAFKDEDIEGIKDITLSLQEVPGYKIAKDAGSVKLNIVDDANSQIQVSFTTSPALLIESEKTVSVHTFNLSATPPKEGLVVSVAAPNISEFDLSGIKIEGGEIARLTSTGFDLKITARTAIIRLPVANDGKAEGLETATFTLQDAPTYQVNPNAIVGSFKIVDTTAQAPVLTVREPNDTIAKAVNTNLNPENNKVSFTSTLDFGFRNSYDDGKGGVIYVDATEDVDMYKVTLKKGDRIYVDTDSNQFGPGRKVDPTLRIFDATGKELAENVDGGAPDEIFAAKWDAYLDFTAPADGDYYIGVSLYNNSSYDPNKPASGSGGDDGEDGTDPEGYGPGEYKLNINLNEPFVAPPTAIKPGNGTGPAISLFSVSGTYRNDFDNLDFGIANQNVFESVPEGLSSAVSLVLTANGEIPSSGVEVFITANTALSNYFDVGAGKPFTRGGQFLDAVYDNTGKVIGFNFRLEQPFATIVLNPVNRETPETNGPESVTFSVVESVGYRASDISSSTITFGDKLPEMKLAVMPNLEASLSVDKTELIESQETSFTITLSLNQKPPQEGIQVYVSGNAQDFLNEFSIFKAQFKGGIPVADGAVSGFYFQMFEQTATITLPVFNSADIIEGIEQFNISLVPDNNPNGYTVNPAKSSTTITIKDTPDSKIQVSLSTEPEVLIESEKTVSVHNFNLSVNPPKDGLTVKVNAPNLSEFDLKGIAVKGGEITAVRADGFDLKITAKTATISLPVADDGKAEGIEKATFTLAPGNGYQINPTATNGTFTIVDTPDQAPISTNELNDTLATAIRTGLSSTNPKVTFEGQMEQHTTGRGANQIQVDITEDVDMYKVDLKAGAKLVIDIDATEIGSKFQFAQIRVFDADGKELAKTGGNSFQAAPDEIFSVFNDPYLEFTPEKAGTYYVGISQIGNDYYDPKVAGSGSGWIFPSADILPGKYKLNLSLSEPVPSKPVVSFTASTTKLNEEEGTPVTFNFKATGEFPKDGIIITTGPGFLPNPQLDLTGFDFSDPAQINGLQFADFKEESPGNFIISWKMTKPEAFIKTKVFNDTLAEPDTTFKAVLLPGDGYTIDPKAGEVNILVTDGVPGVGGPKVGFSIDKTTLSEGDEFTINFKVDGLIPKDGLRVYVDSDIFGVLGEFQIFDEDGNSALKFEGLKGIPQGNEDASGFSVVMAENTAKLTLKVFRDEVAEGTESFNFKLADGENYDVQPDASKITLNISDPTKTPAILYGNNGNDNLSAGDGNNIIYAGEGNNTVTTGGGNDIIHAGAGNDIISAGSGNNIIYAGEGNNKITAGVGKDLIYAGAGDDKISSGAGDDLIYAGEGKNTIDTGTGLDQVYSGSGADVFKLNKGDGFVTINGIQTIDKFTLGTGLAATDLKLTQKDGDTIISAADDQLAVIKWTQLNSLNLA